MAMTASPALAMTLNLLLAEALAKVALWKTEDCKRNDPAEQNSDDHAGVMLAAAVGDDDEAEEGENDDTDEDNENKPKAGIHHP